MLIDFHDRRIADIDAHGIEFAILGLNSPALQAILDPAEAVAVTRKANDILAGENGAKSRPLRGLFASMASTNKSLALVSKTPEIAPGIVKGLARNTAFNWASYIDCLKKSN